ncbi:MAG: ABC transporter permease [Candidatus Thermoplasmatota archaeon]
MDLVLLLLLVGALAATLVVAVAAVRRPILWRMAIRNAARRPKQSFTVIAGLLIGTAIISSALVAGDSASYAIRGYVYQSLGAVDESVAIQGYPYFPEAVADAFANDAAIQRNFDGVARHVIWQGALEDPATGLFQPNVAVIGYELEADAAFGDYELGDGRTTDGRTLRPGQAIATRHLADELGLAGNERLTLSYVPPVDPLLPRITWTNGTVVGSVDLAPLGIPGLATIPAVTSSHEIAVEAGASAFVVALGTNPAIADQLPPTVALRVRVVAPDGTVTTAAGEPGEVPLLLNITSAPDATLQVGAWTVEVAASGTIQVEYVGVAVVAYPVYDLALLQERARALQGQLDEFRDELGPLNPFGARATEALEVVAITTGGRGSLFDFRDALFIPIDEAQRLFEREGEVNFIKFSNPGNEETGEAGSDEAVLLLNATLERVKATYAELPSVQALETKPLKQEFLAVADRTGETLTNLLLFAGTLSILTGLLLILNIFTMLAQERRSELGMARAVGLTQRDLVRLSLFEGALYAVVAAFLGSLLGLGLAYVMIEVMNSIIARISTDLSFPPITYRPSVQALLGSFAAGALLTFLTVYGAARRQAGLNIVRAVRRIEEPDVAGAGPLSITLGLPLTIVGFLAGGLGWIPNPITTALFPNYTFSLQVFGPLVGVLGLSLLLRPFAKRRTLYPLLAGALALYYAVTYFVIGRYNNPTETQIVGPLRGVLLTLAIVIIVVHIEAVPRLLSRLLSGIRPLRAIALPAMSYPLHKKFRTGMTLAMFSVVILSIGFFSIFGALFQADPSRQSGGFDVEAVSTLTVPDLAPYDRGLIPAGLLAGRWELPAFRSEDRGFITVSGGQTGTFREFRHIVYGYDASFAEVQEFGLIERLPEYTDDQAVYRDVLARDDRVIVSYLYSTNAQGQAQSHRVGETLEINLGDDPVRFTIAGIQEQVHYPGIFLPRDRVEELFPATATVYLFKLSEGSDAEAAARLLESNYRDVGLDAKATEVEVLEEQASFRQVLGAMKLFLGLSLLVGVLSLGIITSRSVLERRQEIGMLRALGYTSRQVRRVFFTEVTFTVLLGSAVGIATSILVTFGLWFAIIRERNFPYVVPWSELGLLVLVSYVVAIAACWAPIGRTGKVAPAEALRYLE